MKKIIHYRFLWKLILTMSVLICFPLLMQIFTVRNAERELTEQNQINRISAASSICSQFTSQLLMLRTHAYRIAADVDFLKPVYSSCTPYTTLTLMEKCRDYAANLTLPENIGIYYRETGTVISSSCCYPLAEYCAIQAGFDSVNQQAMMDFISADSTDSIRFFSADLFMGGTNGTKLIAAIPVHLRSYASYDALVFYILPSATIGTYLENAALAENWSFLLINRSDGAVLYNNIADTELTERNEFRAFVNNPSTASDQLYTDGTNSCYRSISENGCYTFVAVIPVSEDQKATLTFYQVMMRTTLIFAICIFILLAFAVYINYHPLDRLVRKVSQNPSVDGSELEKIENTFLQLDQRLSNQQLQFMDYLLNGLLFGLPISKDKLHLLMPELEMKYTCVISVLCGKLSNLQSIIITNALQERTGHSFYYTNLPRKSDSIFIVTSSETLDPEALHDEIVSILTDTLDHSCPIGVGSVILDISEVHASYLKSQTELEAQSNPVEQKDEMDSIKHMTTVFVQLLKNGNEKQSLKNLDQIFQRIEAPHSIILERYMCYELLNAYIDYLDASGHALSHCEKNALLGFSSLDQLHDLIAEKVCTLCQQIASAHEKEDDLLCRDMLRYVDEHYTSESLCLLEIAEYFNLSIYIVSRMLKNYIGIGFKEYLNARRLEQGANLLLTTSETVVQISAMCGFSNVTYFTNLFKAQYGVSPNRYRGKK